MFRMFEFRLMLFPNFKEKAVTLSYDDGHYNDKRLIEIMSKYGLKGTFNLNSGLLGKNNKVDISEINSLYLETGNEIAIHGVNHLYLTSIPKVSAIEDVFQDRKNFEKITGEIIKGMAYAYGAYNDEIVTILKQCGIKYSRTTDDTEDFRISDDWLRWRATCHHNNPKLFELVDDFLTEGKHNSIWTYPPKLFYLWGHSYEFSNDDNWDRIERFAEKIGNNDNVWYATNGEIVDYVEAYKALSYSADGKTIYNPTQIDVYIRTLTNEKIIIPKGKEIKL